MIDGKCMLAYIVCNMMNDRRDPDCCTCVRGRVHELRSVPSAKTLGATPHNTEDHQGTSTIVWVCNGGLLMLQEKFRSDLNFSEGVSRSVVLAEKTQGVSQASSSSITMKVPSLKTVAPPRSMPCPLIDQSSTFLTYCPSRHPEWMTSWWHFSVRL